MLTLEIIRVAFAAIRANALRSVLTALGIVIGVAAVIAVVSMGEGAQRGIQATIERMGTNVLSVRPGQSMMGGMRSGGSDGAARLTLEDAEALRMESGGLLTVSPEARTRLQLAYLRWNSSHDVIGVWPEYFGMYNLPLAFGRYFTYGEVEGRRRVAVLGAHIPDELGTPAPLLVGKTIQIAGQPVEVIGVLEEKGDAIWLRPDNQAFVPATTGIYRLFGRRGRLNTIFTATRSPDEAEMAYAEIDRIMRRQHRIQPGDEADFNVSSAADLVESFGETTRIFSALLIGIAAISLLVGGIGIMNIMLVSVTERTREIGVRKAMGATRRAVLFQFLIEALTLCTLGGVGGVAAGWAGSWLVNSFAPIETAVSMVAVLGALGFSAGIGLFFGIWPAQRAARLDPIDALRYE